MKMPPLDLLLADKKKLAAAALCACLAVYADVSFVIGWQMKSVSGAKKEIAAARASIDAVSRDKALLNNAQGAAAKVKLRRENDIPDLLRWISAVSAEHTIRIIQITPLKSRDSKTQGYLGLTVKLELTGGYHDVGMFLNRLERGEHPLAAEEIRISQGEDFMRQRVNLNLRTYVKKQ